MRQGRSKSERQRMRPPPQGSAVLSPPGQGACAEPENGSMRSDLPSARAMGIQPANRSKTD